MNDVSVPAHADNFSLANTNELEDGLNDDLRSRVKCELEPGERLLWAARCDTSPEPWGAGFYVVCIERPAGSGTLEFYGTRADVDFGYYHSFRFAGVPDVRRVEQIVRNNLMTSEPNT
jgi:hypothetical protein